jgi:hypothetical protein
VTDVADSCMGCGGHLRANVWSGTLCPICEKRHERGEMTKFGRLVERADLDPKELPDGSFQVAA